MLAALAAANAVPAEPKRSVFLEELTSPELAAAVRSGHTTLLVPVGGTEQNGPYLALGKHNARSHELAGRIAQKLDDAIVAPVVAYVPEGSLAPPAGHMRYPGTITVPEDAFERILESAARSFRLHGFTTIVFLPDHGGYRASLKRVAARMAREWKGSGARVLVSDAYYEAQTRGFASLLAARGFTPEEIGEHGGVADTALTIATAPSLVRQDALAAAASPKAEGLRGDPRRSSVELGRLGADLVVERTVAEIRGAIGSGRR
jgi:creatinine amidohydrolase